jgi:hypothetical protein
MPAMFRIVDTESPLHSKPAALNARELAAMRVILQSAGRYAIPDDGEMDGTAFNFEHNANAVPIASFASTLDDREDILAIIEEAQFLGRAIRVSRASINDEPQLQVSPNIALSPPIAVTFEQAERVLECLGFDVGEVRSIPLAMVREKLHEPASSFRFDRCKLSYIFDYLVRLCDTDCGDQIPHLAWA